MGPMHSKIVGYNGYRWKFVEQDNVCFWTLKYTIKQILKLEGRKHDDDHKNRLLAMHAQPSFPFYAFFM